MNDTTIIRASSLPGYGDCSRMWAARTLSAEIFAIGYNLNRNVRTSIGARVGTATHTGAAYIMTEKMASGSLGNQTEAEHRAIEEFKGATDEGVLWDDTSPDIGDAQKQIARMIKVFRATLAPVLTPVAVERRMECTVGEGFVLSGQSDLQIVAPNGIDDIKTGRVERKHYGQIGAYSLLSRSNHPEIPVEKLRVQFIPRVPLKKEQPLPVTEEYDQPTAEQAAVSALKHIMVDVNEFRRRTVTGDAPPEHVFMANPASLLCSPKFCPAFGTDFCREHKKLKPTIN